MARKRRASDNVKQEDDAASKGSSDEYVDASEPSIVKPEPAASEKDQERPSKKRKPGEFAPGAVVRVRMHNFVTFSDVEFHLGSSLNMVVGPNGTGKSTFISALCLGLLGKPDMLKETSDISIFVKRGHHDALIEVELYNDEGTNYVVQRRFTDTGKTSWLLDGKRVPFTELEKLLIHKYNIQVGNLCQFLPQEKVSRFAEASPEQLLLSTEEAVGTRAMVEQHRKLSEYGTELMLASQSTSRDVEDLEAVRKQIQDLETQLEVVKEFEGFQERLKAFQTAEPYAAYVSRRSVVDQLKTDLRDKQKELEEQRNENRAFTTLSQKSEKRLAKTESELVLARSKRYKVLGGVMDLRRNMSNDLELVKDLELKLENNHKSCKRLEEKIELREKDVEDSVRKLERAQEQEATSAEQLAQITAEYDALTTRLREARVEEEEAEDNIRALDNTARELSSQRQRFSTMLEQIGDAENRKLAAISRLSNVASKVVEVLRRLPKVRAQFRMQVFEPPIVVCKLTRPRMAPAVGYATTLSSLLTFTVLCKEDFDTFSRLFIDEGLNVSLREYSQSKEQQPEDHAKPFTQDQLKNTGLDGYILDLIDGPAPVMNMLCHTNGLHRIGYTERALSSKDQDSLSDKYKASVLANASGVGALGLSKYCHGDIGVTLSVSNYGARAVSVRSQPLNQSAAIDVIMGGGKSDHDDNEVHKLKDSILSTDEKLVSVRNKANDQRTRHADLQSLVHQLRGEQSTLRNRRDELRSRNSLRATLGTRIATGKREIEGTKAKLEELRLSRVNALEPQRTKVIKALSNPPNRLFDLLNESVYLDHEIARLTLSASTCTNEIQTFGLLANYGISELEEVISDIKSRGKTANEELKVYKERLRALTEDQLVAAKEVCEQYSIEQIQAEIAKLQGQISLAQEGRNIATLQRLLEEKQAEETRLSTRVESSQNNIVELRNNIDRIYVDWKPRLESTISQVSNRFSQAMDSVNCKGKVELVVKDDDYKNWALEIMVSFRENAPLQRLQAGRQSGGEKSLSTIFYLMSLQEFAQSPFRAVDEINQGMDPYNEERVHNRMVEVACNQTSSQYFLVTPKLLQGLEYGEGMRICCVYSGRRVKLQGKQVGARAVLNALNR